MTLQEQVYHSLFLDSIERLPIMNQQEKCQNQKDVGEG
jgi:hypothetical protein